MWVWITKMVAGPEIKAAWNFFVANFKYLVLLLLVALVFWAGKWYQAKDTVKQLTAMKDHYEKVEKERADSIDTRIQKAEANATKKVAEAEKAKQEANDRADSTEKKYKNQLKERATKLAVAETKLAELKKAGKKDTDKDVIDTNTEIEQLKMTYTLSPITVDTINKFVEDFQ
jgi:hypothetical protein